MRLNDNQLSGCIPSNFRDFCILGNGFDLSNNPDLPWSGDTDQFCATDGSQAAQVGAPCDDQNSNTINDQIDENCNCVGEAVASCAEDTIRNLLLEFYESTGGPTTWLNTTGWADAFAGNDSTACNYCEWYGVGCDADGNLLYLDLDGVTGGNFNSLNGNGLTGSIPPSLAQINSLNGLYLAENNLEGNFPEELGNLDNLQYLYLTNNNLSGPLPDAFAQLDQLLSLFLGGNQFTGPLPPSIGQMDNLEFLYMNGRGLGFSGTIPTNYYGLTNLQGLGLQNNQLEGEIPPEILGLPQLEALLLNGNNFSGPLPDAPATSNITDLNLSQNNLNGCFPDSYDIFCGDGITYDFIGNDSLAFRGDFTQFCNGLPQVGAPCAGASSFISEDCNCELSETCVGDFSSISFQLDSVSAIPGTNACIPIRVFDFSDVASLNLSFAFDPNLIRFTGSRNFAPETPENEWNFDLSADLDTVQFSFQAWNEDQACEDLTNGVTLDDNTVLFEICYTAVPEATGLATVHFVPDLQYSDATKTNVGGNCTLPLPIGGCSGQVNILPATCEDGIRNGNETFLDCGGPDCDPCTGQVTIDLSEETGEVGESVCVDIYTRDFSNIIGFQFPISFDTAVLSYQSTTSNPAFIPLFQSVLANPGELRMLWVNFNNPLTLADSSVIATICFNIRSSAPTVLDFTGGIEVQFNNADSQLQPFFTFPGSVNAAVTSCQDDIACLPERTVPLPDNCFAEIDLADLVSGPLGCLDTTDLQLIIADENPLNGGQIDGVGNFAYQIQCIGENCAQANFNHCQGEIIVIDNIPPVLDNCPVSFTTTIGEDNVDLLFLEPEVDDCGDLSLVMLLDGNLPAIPFDGTAFANFLAGTTTEVTYRATDENGSQDECSFTITVIQRDICAGLSTDFAITEPNCGEQNGRIQVNLIDPDNVGPYTLDWSTGLQSTLPAGASNSFLENLGYGNYALTITAANGCQLIETFSLSYQEEFPELVCPDDINLIIDETAIGVLMELPLPEIDACFYEVLSYSLNGDFSGSNDGDVPMPVILVQPSVTEVKFFLADQAACSYTVIIESQEEVCGDFAININSVVGDDCDVTPSGAIQITVTGGDGNYTYAWSNGASSEDIDGLLPGVYSLTATDGNGCSLTNSFLVESDNLTSISCDITPQVSGNDGVLRVFVDPGDEIGTITVTLPDGSVNTVERVGPDTLIYNNLGYGNYQVTLTNAAGCSTECSGAFDLVTDCGDALNCPSNLVFTMPDDCNLTLTTAELLSGEYGCLTPEDIRLTIADDNPYNGGQVDGTGRFNYLLDCRGPNCATAAQGACFGNLEVRDETPPQLLACPVDFIVTIGDPSVELLLLQRNVIDCGSIELTYRLDDAFPQEWTNTEIVSFQAGTTTLVTYFATDEYANQDSCSYLVTVQNPDACESFTTMQATVAQPDCGQADGAIFAAVNNADPTETYTFQWSTGEVLTRSGNNAADTLTELPIGAYAVTITAAGGCQSVETYLIGFNNLPPLGCPEDINITIDEDAAGLFMDLPLPLPEIDNCYLPLLSYELSGDFSGSGTGNWPTPSVLLRPSSSTIVFDFPQGQVCTYNINITRAVDACRDFTLEINSITPDECGDNPVGAIDLATQGGDGNYQYNWSNGGTTEDINELRRGTYTLTVTDGAGCQLSQGFLIETENISVDTIFQDTLICPGSQLVFFNQILSESGVYTGASFDNSSSNCPAITVLQLTVADTLPPVISCPPMGPTLYAQADSISQIDSLAFVAEYPVSATDNCASPQELTISLDLPDDLSSSTEATYTIADAAGNTASCEVSISVIPTASISGFIRRENGQAVPNVSVSCVGNGDTLRTLTDANGRYTFPAVAQAANYLITPSYDGDNLEGVSLIDVVTMQDIIRSENPPELSPYCSIAANVSNSGRVSLIDIIQLTDAILRVGPFQNSPAWRFVPTDYVFPETALPFSPYPEVIIIDDLAGDQTMLNFVGIKIGDIQDCVD
ncbi:MAG: HYR domain-containing protein [Bacteroidota bacterium]